MLTYPLISKSDIGYSWQFGFQDTSSEVMESLINLHHDIMFFLILIIFKIIILLIITLNSNTLLNNLFKKDKEFFFLKDNKFKN